MIAVDTNVLVHAHREDGEHPRIFAPPSPTREAVAAVTGLAALPNIAFLGEAPDHLGRLAELLGAAWDRSGKFLTQGVVSAWLRSWRR
jgi:hypothetical protein